MKPVNSGVPIRFVTLFLLFVVGFTFLLRLSWIDSHLVEPYTKALARISSGALNLLGESSQPEGTVIRQGSFAVEIRRECDGLVATILLVSACLAYPFSWGERLIGSLLGYGLIFMLNLARVVVLFYVGMRNSAETFDFMHIYVSQFAVIALTMVFWIFWAGRRRAVRQ